MEVSIAMQWLVKRHFGGNKYAHNNLSMSKLYKECQQDPGMRQKNMVMSPAGPRTPRGEPLNAKHDITENPHCWRP
jgi:hypothetical protein